MRSKLQKRLVVQGLIGVIAGYAGIAFADAPAVKWYDAIGLSGYAQTSYVGNLNRPHAAGTGAKVGNTGRQFDTDSNGFSFNTFLLQIARPVTDNWGFVVRLRTGQDATLLPGGVNLTVQECSISYTPNDSLSIVCAKYSTHAGFV